jgi:hypothetical protein
VTILAVPINLVLGTSLHLAPAWPLDVSKTLLCQGEYSRWTPTSGGQVGYKDWWVSVNWLTVSNTFGLIILHSPLPSLETGLLELNTSKTMWPFHEGTWNVVLCLAFCLDDTVSSCQLAWAALCCLVAVNRRGSWSIICFVGRHYNEVSSYSVNLTRSQSTTKKLMCFLASTNPESIRYNSRANRQGQNSLAPTLSCIVQYSRPRRLVDTPTRSLVEERVCWRGDLTWRVMIDSEELIMSVRAEHHGRMHWPMHWLLPRSLMV